MDSQVKTDVALWLDAMGFNGKQVGQAAEQLGISAGHMSRKKTGEKEPTLTERLAMAALRAQLPPWSPEKDKEIAAMAAISSLVYGLLRGAGLLAPNPPASAEEPQE